MALSVQLGLLESSGLIQLATVQPQLEYLFRHGLIQDAAYSTLLRGQRRAWHLAAAEVLEQNCQTEVDLRAQAQTIVGYIADHAPTPALRHSFQARLDVRALMAAA